MKLPGNANDIDTVVLDGETLGLAQVVAVARHRARVTLGEGARDRVACSRAVVDRLIRDRAKVYGLTTGFGSKRDVVIDPDEVGQLQLNLIRSHACGVGPSLPEDEVRAMMLLRANTLARGNSGVRIRVIQALLDFLNQDVYPWIPSRGSLGASGDLAPLSHLALSLCNDPGARFYAPPEPNDAPYVDQPHLDWFRDAKDANPFDGNPGLEPLVLEAKEGLGLNNGTQVTTAIGLLTLYDAIVLLESAELVCGLSLEANKANQDAFDPRLHAARPMTGQREVAANLLAFTRESQILNLPLNNARLQRARWAITAARDSLATQEGEAATEFVEEADAIGRRLTRFEEDVVPLLETGLDALPKETREASADRVLARQIYREHLTPIREEVLHLYIGVLRTSLSGAALKGRDFLADAVLQLQLALPETPSVQDDYSFRCTPQVLGAVRKAVGDTLGTLVTEANSATDNPLVFPPRAETFKGDPQAYADGLTERECLEAVVSGGNFHGEPLAVALDTLGIALAELGNISERRTAHLVDGNLSNGLPSLLIANSGLNSGFMIPQYVAASLVSENKILAHPASVDSIPSCENTEDHVSMSPIAALKCRQILRHVETVIAIELITAWQGVYFRRPLRCGSATEALWLAMEQGGMTPVTTDRVLYRDIEWAREMLSSGQVWRIARGTAPSVLD